MLTIHLFIGVDGPIGDNLKDFLEILERQRTISIEWFPENRGLACVLNDLLDICFKDGYEYIARMDADDISMPDRIEKQIAYLETHPEIDVVGGAIEEIDENGDSRNKTIIYPETPEACRAFFSKRNPHAHPAVMLRRSLCRACRFDENLQGCKADVVSEPMVNYYNYRNQTQVSSSTAKYIQATDYINKKYATLFERLSPQEYKQKQVNDIMLLGNKAMRNNSPREARMFYVKAFKLLYSTAPVVAWALSFFGFKNMLRLKSMLK